MSEIKFEMRQVTEKREKTVVRGSIYDPLLDEFISRGHDLVEMTVEGRKVYNIVAALRKRVVKRELDIDVSYAGDFVYLEKKPSE